MFSERYKLLERPEGVAEVNDETGVPIELERKDPTLERIQTELIRKMTSSEKLRRVYGMRAAMHDKALSDVRHIHPQADQRECMLRIASRRVPADLMLKAFGWDVREKGY